MTTHHHDQSSQRTGTWLLAVFGAVAVAGLIAALVWVVQGQMQQAQVLRAQWQDTPRAVQATRAESGRDASAPGRGNRIIAASFGRP